MKRDLKTWKLSMMAWVDGKTLCFDGLLSGQKQKRMTQDRYVLTVETTDVIRLSLKRRDAKKMKVDHVEYHFSAPLLNFSKIILPDTGRTYMEKDKAIYLRSAVTGVTAPNDGHPFLAVVDQAGDVSFSFGLLTSSRETTFIPKAPKISARKALLGGEEVFTIAARVPTAGWTMGSVAEVKEDIFMGTGFKSWFHAHKAYTDIIRKHENIKYPFNPAALDPTWCSWTAWCSDEMNEKSILANAAILRDLGIPSIILDDGWFGPGLDTDDRPLNIGDYYPDPQKFENMPKLVDKLHDMGLKVLLWYAPTCISPDSQAWKRWSRHTIMNKGKKVFAPNGFYSLCPCNPEARAYFCDEIARMLDDYNADGFKVDLYNTLPATPCDNPHEHDTDSMIEGVRRTMKDIWDICLSRNADSLMELKQNYGNVISAQYGSMVRAGDAAYDTDVTLRRCFYQQSYARVVHNDYLSWSIHDKPAHLAIMLIKQITAGVPTFSADMVKMPASHISVLKAWMDFYHTFHSVWSQPRAPQNKQMDVWEMKDRHTAIISVVFDACEAQIADREQVVLMNGSSRNSLFLTSPKPRKAFVRIYDHRHQLVSRGKIEFKPTVQVNVPCGGMMVIGEK